MSWMIHPISRDLVRMREYLAELINDRKIWARVYDLETSRTVFNPLIKHHIARMRKQPKVTMLSKY